MLNAEVVEIIGGPRPNSTVGPRDHSGSPRPPHSRVRVQSIPYVKCNLTPLRPVYPVLIHGFINDSSQFVQGVQRSKLLTPSSVATTPSWRHPFSNFERALRHFLCALSVVSYSSVVAHQAMMRLLVAGRRSFDRHAARLPIYALGTSLGPLLERDRVSGKARTPEVLASLPGVGRFWEDGSLAGNLTPIPRDYSIFPRWLRASNFFSLLCSQKSRPSAILSHSEASLACRHSPTGGGPQQSPRAPMAAVLHYGAHRGLSVTGRGVWVCDPREKQLEDRHVVVARAMEERGLAVRHSKV